MTTPADDLVDLLDLEAIDLNLFRGKQPETTRQRVFGGQVAGQSMVAASRTVPADRACHSLHSYFLRPGDHSVPIVYDVDRVRDGRSFTTRRVLARQHGQPIYAMTASFQVEESGFEHQDRIPQVPAPEESPDLRTVLSERSPRLAQEWNRDWASLEVRLAEQSRPGSGLPTDAKTVAVSRCWIKVRGRLPDDRLTHQAALTYLSDLTLLGATLVPHDEAMNGGVQAASLDHTVWFHRPFRADEWLLYDQSSPTAQGGRGLALGRLFSQAGQLVASVAQEGLIRPVSRG